MTPTPEGMPQRWKLERGPDGAWNTAQMTTTEDGEWCKAEDVASALQEAEHRGYRAGVEAMRPYADHTWACRLKHGGDRCTCGLEGLLAEGEKG